MNGRMRQRMMGTRQVRVERGAKHKNHCLTKIKRVDSAVLVRVTKY